MPIGPGKYDDACTRARIDTEASGVLLVIMNGKHGPGFSVQAPPEVMARVPTLLRLLADGIEHDMPASKS